MITTEFSEALGRERPAAAVAAVDVGGGARPDGSGAGSWRVGYLVKRYPRFSETFIVNEILAHEAAGHEVAIFSLGACNDTHFQNAISQVRAPVTYLPPEAPKAADFWRVLRETSAWSPAGLAWVAEAGTETAREVYQALVLAGEIRRRGLEHLHAHFATGPATVARLAARLAGVPFSFTAHAKDIFHEDVSAADLRRKLREADAVITVSDFNLAHLRETYGTDAARVVRLFNGLDLRQFPFVSPAERPAEILAVGRLVEKKGFDVLVSACGLLAARGVSFRCRIVGTGEQEPALRRQIAEAGLTGHVELAGPRPQREIIALLQGAAALAAPCVVGADGDRDGMPTVLLEAMAVGTPCVATPVTGIPEVVRDGETGLLVAERDVEGLAGALVRLLRDGALRLALASKARRRMEQDFDVAANAARQRTIFGVCRDQRRARDTGSAREELSLAGVGKEVR